MRKSVFQVNKRQQAALDQLENDRIVYVNRLSEQFGVSEITIRRDLETMEKAGLLTRFHGGARILEEPTPEATLFDEKDRRNIDEKLLIARRAAELVREDDMIFMNSGSTVTHVPQFLQGKRVTIITNNTKMPCIDYGSNVNLLLTGGAHNKSTHSLTGELAKHALEQVYATVCIMGVNGISAEDGITTSVYQETEINNMMLKRCRGKRIILADSSKVGRIFNFISAPINRVDVLITTSKADPKELEKLSQCGVEVLVVPFQEVRFDASGLI